MGVAHSFCYILLLQYKASASDFTSVVLIRMLPGALSRLVLPMTSLFCFALVVSTTAGSSTKLDSLKNK